MQTGGIPSCRSCCFSFRATAHDDWNRIGFRNVIIRWPKQHLAVIILSNRNHLQPYPIALTIGELYLTH